MSEGVTLPAATPRRPKGRLGVFAPWPLVGVVLLLVALVVVTPVLVANTHQPGPGLLTQAELVVDKIPSNATLHFYVWALGETIRYDTIQVGVATSFNWTGGSSLNWSSLNWTQWHNESDVLSVNATSTANPIALNITAHYAPGGGAYYVGQFVFYVAGPPGSETLYSATDTPGVAVASPLAVSNDTLPVAILLYNAGSGAP